MHVWHWEQIQADIVKWIAIGAPAFLPRITTNGCTRARASMCPCTLHKHSVQYTSTTDASVHDTDYLQDKFRHVFWQEEGAPWWVHADVRWQEGGGQVRSEPRKLFTQVAVEEAGGVSALALWLATPSAHHKARYSTWFWTENFKQSNVSPTNIIVLSNRELMSIIVLGVFSSSCIPVESLYGILGLKNTS